MKQIVILVDQLHSVGGIERLVVMKANYWAAIFGYSVTIISTEQRQQPFAYELSDQVRFVDLAINYDRSKSYFKSKNIFKFVRNIKKLRNELKVIQPDFIIVASHIPITYCVNFFKGNAKTIKEFHFSKYNQTDNFKSKLENILYDAYNYLVVLSPEEQSFSKSAKTVVIANPITSNSLLNCKDQKKDNKAIFLGRIAPVKNIEDLIYIWSEFIKEKSDWILEIYGADTDEYAKSLKQKVLNLNLTQSIIFMGETKETSAKLEEAKVLLLTSHHECFPLVILEALALAVPVFSYNCPTGPRNILTDRYDGRLIANKNREQFVAALTDFANNESHQRLLSQNAVQTANNYSIFNIMKLWNTKIFKNDLS
ncbi:glycosyltransferase [Flavobacterium sp.]|uniref:glycosyltransferase n=1 Tax=Flavobacterium sp. TaxID=239 RepID=UPI00260D0383|nr:glycosyltransferase [Flavobacterium sp.]MDG2431244.1 glycosyltransferase [Flavobacterium sp.]